MLPQIEDLLIIQEKDLRIQQLRQELDRTPKEQEAARDRLRAVVEAMDSAKSTVQGNEVAIKTVELDIGTRKESISRMKSQQFETRKNEEYTTLGHEITRYEGDVDQLETKELELMEKADELRQDLAEAKKAHDAINHGVEEEIKDLGDRADGSRVELAGLEAERTAAMASISEDLAAQYERLLSSRGAPVVSAVTSEGMCTGCHVKVTPSKLVSVRTAKESASCENCGRILYSE